MFPPSSLPRHSRRPRLLDREPGAIPTTRQVGTFQTSTNLFSTFVSSRLTTYTRISLRGGKGARCDTYDEASKYLPDQYKFVLDVRIEPEGTRCDTYDEAGEYLPDTEPGATPTTRQVYASLASTAVDPSRRYNLLNLKAPGAYFRRLQRDKTTTYTRISLRGGRKCVAVLVTKWVIQKSLFRCSRRTGKPPIRALLQRGGMGNRCGAYDEKGIFISTRLRGNDCASFRQPVVLPSNGTTPMVLPSNGTVGKRLRPGSSEPGGLPQNGTIILRSWSSPTNIHPRSTRYPWTKQPMAADKDPSVRRKISEFQVDF
ncbi:hypothetical protein M5K25_008637 [Dendrobium thyrsiflorum]|uniref:Uncharacterized protein n=1 Tax=Dendrobium thyrsiflorum TaxID=117978 RepID=A0ABD0V944_DENTH